MELRVDPARLHKLLGQALTWQGMSCQIIEILMEGPALVLREAGGPRVIQANQYGAAGEHLPRTFTVNVFNARRDGLNPELPELVTHYLVGS